VRRVAGQIRRSQLIFTFGVGSLVDLPQLTVVTMGLDFWPRAQCPEISEPRLLAAVRAYCGRQVKEIRASPLPADLDNQIEPKENAGVPVRVFPGWLRCPLCRLLAPLESGHFELRQEPFRLDRLRYVHTSCPESGRRSPSRKPGMMPAQFVLACENGHLDDFPWVDYCHRGGLCAAPVLRLSDGGVSGGPTEIWVACEACGQKRPMSDAFSMEGTSSHEEFSCPGRHVHLQATETCEAPKAQPILIGASNSYFSITLSALSLPGAVPELQDLVAARWDRLGSVRDAAVLEYLRGQEMLEGLEAFGNAEILAAIESLRAARSAAAVEDHAAGTLVLPALESPDLKRPEWELLTSGQRIDTPEMLLREAPPPGEYSQVLERVVLVESLTEVRALIGYTRIEAAGELAEVDPLPRERWGPLSRRPPRWVPGVQFQGEGVFLQFREGPIAAWESRPEVRAREDALLAAYQRWCEQRPWLKSVPKFPGARAILLHSLAHALIREMGIRCGYGTASIRERIYSAEAEDGPMAGILLMTASPDSEGTLGGLVAQGSPERLEGILAGALERLRLCSSDPLCAHYEPERGHNLHGAACHACAFLPETCCERANRFLDRALVVRTLAGSECGFFDEP
jgi:hypothetical protein